RHAHVATHETPGAPYLAPGQNLNEESTSVPLIAQMNCRACNFAPLKCFACADSFAEFMAAEYDSNGDGLVDSDAIRFVNGESEAAYINKITTTYRSTLRDANVHLVSAGSSFDYIQSDNTHPKYKGSQNFIGL